VWVLIGGDTLVFSLLFVTYLTYRNASLAMYDRGQRLLDLPLGFLNTILLLSSSWCVAQGVRAARGNHLQPASIFIGLGFVCGVGFVAIKAVEYHEKFAAGIDIGTNEFFMFYFVLTGIHLLHVLVGLGVLAGLRYKIRSQVHMSDRDMAIIESGATFWHLVDVLWIVLFALLYLTR
jgi:nitric oxide reductase NorE protein